MGKVVVVGVTGLECSGKTRFSEALKAALESRGLNVAIVSTEVLLDQALSLFNLSQSFNARVRFRQALEQIYGERLIIDAMRARINGAGADVVIWDGVRTQVNMRELVNEHQALVIVVERSMEKRVQLLCKRVPAMSAEQVRKHFISSDRQHPLAEALLKNTDHLRVRADVETELMQSAETCATNVYARCVSSGGARHTQKR